MKRAEIDSNPCGDCFFFRYKDSDKFGWQVNETGAGYCVKLDPEKTVIINAENSVRESLEALGKTEERAEMERTNSSCFKFRGLEISEEQLTTFYPDLSSRRKARDIQGIINKLLGDTPPENS